MGWCKFDPANNIISGERYIVMAYGRD